jgi:RecB family endonuclease NucS
VAYEKKVEPGFIDIYGLDSENRLVVAELKRVRAGRAAALQLAKYVEHVRRTTPLNVRGVLAAPKIAKGTQRILATLGLEFVPVDLEKCAQVIASRRDKRMVEFLR